MGQKGVQNRWLLFQFLLIKNIRFQQQLCICPNPRVVPQGTFENSKVLLGVINCHESFQHITFNVKLGIYHNLCGFIQKNKKKNMKKIGISKGNAICSNQRLQ